MTTARKPMDTTDPAGPASADAVGTRLDRSVGRLYCHLVRGTVQQMGVCVQWAPVRRWVAA